MNLPSGKAEMYQTEKSSCLNYGNYVNLGFK